MLRSSCVWQPHQRLHIASRAVPECGDALAVLLGYGRQCSTFPSCCLFPVWFCPSVFSSKSSGLTNPLCALPFRTMFFAAIPTSLSRLMRECALHLTFEHTIEREVRLRPRSPAWTLIASVFPSLQSGQKHDILPSLVGHVAIARTYARSSALVCDSSDISFCLANNVCPSIVFQLVKCSLAAWWIACPFGQLFWKLLSQRFFLRFRRQVLALKALWKTERLYLVE